MQDLNVTFKQFLYILHNLSVELEKGQLIIWRSKVMITVTVENILFHTRGVAFSKLLSHN